MSNGVMLCLYTFLLQCVCSTAAVCIPPALYAGLFSQSLFVPFTIGQSRSFGWGFVSRELKVSLQNFAL